MNNERIIRKIKHCLALSQSSNADEAATALRQAQKLMQMHNVTSDDTSVIDIKEHRVTALTKTRPPQWHGLLAAVIADAMGCHYFCGVNKRGHSGHSNFCFIGFDYQPEIAAYAFEVLIRQAIKDRRNFINQLSSRVLRKNKKLKGDNFCIGWINGVRSVVNSFALSDGQMEAIEYYKSVKYPNLCRAPQKTLKKYRGADDDRINGYLLGRKANLNRGAGYQDAVRLESHNVR